MKTTTIFFLFTIVSNFLFGQTPTQIITPLGHTVPDTYLLGELLDATTKAALSDSIRLNYPNATEVEAPSATTHYNCHSYAWYRSEGGYQDAWIGYDYATSEDIYWLDGSFIQTSTINDGNKISYAGNHSAIINSGTNCRSKWGPWPLVDHPIGYGPLQYNMSQRTYYTTLSMGGPTILCTSSSVTYSTPAYVNCTFNWTYDTNRFNYISGQGTNNFQIAPKNPLVSGQAWVKLTLTINFSTPITREITKTVWVGTPIVTSVTGASPLGVYQPATYYAELSSFSSLPDSYSWGTSPLPGVTITSYGHYASIMFTQPGWYQVVAKAHNACGWSSYAMKMVNVISGYSMAISPNPATGETTVELVNDNKEALAALTEWDYEIYDSMQGLKEKKTKLKGTQAKINTSGWNDGIYIIRAKIGDEVITEKLVVKH